MKTFIQYLALSILAIFAPIKATIIAVVALVLFDFVTGVAAAIKTKTPITSSGFKRTLGKLFVYEVTLCIAFLVHQYLTGDTFPADKIVAAMIGLTELKSILENLETLTGEPLVKTLLDKVISTQDPPK